MLSGSFIFEFPSSHSASVTTGARSGSTTCSGSAVCFTMGLL